jgi:hypothetical protein
MRSLIRVLSQVKKRSFVVRRLIHSCFPVQKAKTSKDNPVVGGLDNEFSLARVS